MRLMPLAWNVLTDATVLTAAAAFEPRFTSADFVAEDFRKPGLCSGQFTVIASHSDRIDYNDGSVRVASLTPATYPNPGAYCQHKAAQMTSAGGQTYRHFWRQDSAGRYLFGVSAAGAFTLLNSTGANAARSALVNLSGYRAMDYGSATSHTADLACVCGPIIGTNYGAGDKCEWDLGSAKTAQACVIIGPRLSPGAMPIIRMGTAAAATDFAEYFGDAADDTLMAHFFDPQTYRYAVLDFNDPHRTDAQENGACYVYLGQYFEPAQDFDVTVFSRDGRMLTSSRVGSAGAPFLTEYAPGEGVTVQFTASPGIEPADIGAFEAILFTLGVENKIIMAFDPDNEPNRETGLFRLTSAPSFGQIMGESRAGRWACSLNLEAEAVL